jgi:integrase/recombinase XerD
LRPRTEAMPRRGQKLKHRKATTTKPPGFKVRAREDDPLSRLPLTRYMDLHFEWMLVTAYSADTVRARRIALRRFIAWCNERGVADPREITKPIIERYQRHLFYYRKPDGAPLTTGTQHSCLAPLKSFFKWLARENHILYNPASELQLPRQPKHLPRTILSVAEVEAILMEAVPDNAQGVRDRALLETLYSTGLRRMELPNLMLYDVDLTRHIVFVREGKGRRDRVIPIGARACAWIDKYLLEARPQLVAGDCTVLFVTDYGEGVQPEYVAAKVKRYMEFAGIHKPGATHLLRHACATHMLEGGADIRFIQAMLGHNSLETTEIYTHVSIDKLREIHAATHPARWVRRQGADADISNAETLPSRENLLAALDADAVADD